jgi:SAM-dependent methyltransferase
MTVWVPARRYDPEWMDRPDNPPESVEGALRDIRRVNRMLGGRRAVLHPLAMLLDGQPANGCLDVLDIGTGGADLPLEMVELGARNGKRVTVTAVDRDPAAAAAAVRFAAHHPGVRIVRADAEDLPFADRSFDLVTASMFLHHFDHRGAVDLLRKFRRIARRAVVVNDLRRHRLPWAFIATVAHVTRRDPMFRHDAPLSVLRGFTDDELRDAARDAGVGSPRIERRWPFRLVMTLPAETTA